MQFYLDEPRRGFNSLGEIKCPVLYVFGGKSDTSTPESIQRKKEKTGNGDAEIIIIQEVGHLPQEEVEMSGSTKFSFCMLIL
jgi:pimeloyl-ACP methyl ester carboxylesterase